MQHKKEMISILIPTFNEVENGFLENILNGFSALANIEVICADGNSNDNTRDIIKKYKVKLVDASQKSRAQRISIGVEHCSNDLILINHPRSLIDIKAIEYLEKNYNKITWGGLTHKFDTEHPLLNFTSWYSNNIRAKINRIIYLDHCIFFKKSKFPNAFPLPPVEIFEDTILSKRLKKYNPIVIPYNSITSSIRFKKNGILKQSIINQFSKACYHLNISDKWLNKIYEKNINLNNKK